MSDLFDYKKEMSALRFTEEQKHQLAQAAAVATQEQKSRKRRPVLRTALIAAAMAAALAAGASAAGVLPEPVDVFAPIFGGAVAQTEVIDKIGHPIGASASDNGITISADAIMGDEYNAVIVYTLTRDDGERFLPEGRSLDETYLTLGGFGGASWVQGGSHGTAWFVDEDPEDNKIQMVETASSDVSMTRGAATAEFRDLCCWDPEAMEPEVLYAGRWKFRFDVDYEDCAVHLDGGETFSQDDLTFTIDEIIVSPIAWKVVYTMDREVVWSDSENERQSSENAEPTRTYMEYVAIFLTKTDGTVMDLSSCGGGMHTDDSVFRCEKGEVFDEIIPLEEMASISVGGVVYDIPHD